MDERIEGLQDLRLIGRGGFGTVYRAWQADFGRDVAGARGGDQPGVAASEVVASPAARPDDVAARPLTPSGVQASSQADPGVDAAGVTTTYQVTVVTGYDEADPADGRDRWQENRRVLALRLTVDDGSSMDVDLTDTRSPQTIATPGLGPTSAVVVEVLRFTDHGGRDFAALSEVGFAGR